MKSQLRILIIGAGPAGLAAAASAAESGAQIDIIDDNFNSGGQIWRGGAQNNRDQRARRLWENLLNLDNVRFHFQSKVVHAYRQENHTHVVIESMDEANQTRYFCADKIILATGARELLLPFPGWTLPGVTGAGGLQALSKNGYPVKGKRIIIAGTGPLLLAVAASLLERGAIVTHILEQASFSQLTKFALSLLSTPSKITQAIQLWMKLRSIVYLSNSYVLAANTVKEEQQVASIRALIRGEEHELPCDFLACAFGLIPNIELAATLNCTLSNVQNTSKVEVNLWQETSQAGVFCAGEGTGVGGVDLALVEGCIAGYAATEQKETAEQYFGERAKWRKFSQQLQKHFSLKPELRQLCQTDTLVCRCEDVTYGQLQVHSEWRSAKLHTRCGMGACQGRICGAANRFLFSWEKDVGRLPLCGAKIISLSQFSEANQ